MKIKNILKKTYKETKRSSLVVYSVLRMLVILCMVIQIIRLNYENALLCLLALVLLMVPFFAQRKFKITLPTTLEVIILLFIFSAAILGEIQNFYNLFPFWDTMLHTINGFLAAAIGFSLVDLLNKNSEKFNLSPLYIFLVAFCFSMTIGVLWEFFEYGADNLLKTDMQKDAIVNNISSVTFDPKNSNRSIDITDIDHTIIYDKKDNKKMIIKNGYLDIGLNDTMEDLFVNFIGAIVFCAIGIIFINPDGKSKFLNIFVPKRGMRKYLEN